MEPTDKPIPNPVVVLREEADDWAILFDRGTSQAVGINPVGVRIWQLMDGQHDLDAIGATVREQFSDVPESAPDEVRGFVEELVGTGFVAT